MNVYLYTVDARDSHVNKLHAPYVGFLIIVITYTFTIISVLESSTEKEREEADKKGYAGIVFNFKRNSRSFMIGRKERKKLVERLFFFSIAEVYNLRKSLFLKETFMYCAQFSNHSPGGNYDLGAL